MRRRKITPSPLSSATAGRIAGSAYGARKRTATCAARNTMVSSSGGSQKSPRCRLTPYATAAAYTVTAPIANSSSASSALRRVGTREPAGAADAGGGGVGAAAVTVASFPCCVLTRRHGGGRGSGRRGGTGRLGGGRHQLGGASRGRGTRSGRRGRRRCGTGRRRARRRRAGHGGAGRTARMHEVAVLRPDQVLVDLLGVGRAARRDALAHPVLGHLGQLVQRHRLGVVHAGQVQAGDLAGDALVHGEVAVRRGADIVLPLAPRPPVPQAAAEH